MVRIENDRTIYGHFQKLILDILPVYLTGGISVTNFVNYALYFC
jgi:hypothetical protein